MDDRSHVGSWPALLDILLCRTNLLAILPHELAGYGEKADMRPSHHAAGFMGTRPGKRVSIPA
jgi:hypothetical protein